MHAKLMDGLVSDHHEVLLERAALWTKIWQGLKHVAAYSLQAERQHTGFYSMRWADDHVVGQHIKALQNWVNDTIWPLRQLVSKSQAGSGARTCSGPSRHIHSCVHVQQ